MSGRGVGIGPRALWMFERRPSRRIRISSASFRPRRSTDSGLVTRRNASALPAADSILFGGGDDRRLGSSPRSTTAAPARRTTRAEDARDSGSRRVTADAENPCLIEQLAGRYRRNLPRRHSRRMMLLPRPSPVPDRGKPTSSDKKHLQDDPVPVRLVSSLPV